MHNRPTDRTWKIDILVNLRPTSAGDHRGLARRGRASQPATNDRERLKIARLGPPMMSAVDRKDRTLAQIAQSRNHPAGNAIVARRCAAFASTVRWLHHHE